MNIASQLNLYYIVIEVVVCRKLIYIALLLNTIVLGHYWIYICIYCAVIEFILSCCLIYIDFLLYLHWAVEFILRRCWTCLGLLPVSESIIGMRCLIIDVTNDMLYYLYYRALIGARMSRQYRILLLCHYFICVAPLLNSYCTIAESVLILPIPSQKHNSWLTIKEGYVTGGWKVHVYLFNREVCKFPQMLLDSNIDNTIRIY